MPLLQNGFVDISTEPRRGTALLPDAQKIRPPVVKLISTRPHFEGLVVDQ